MSRNLIDSIEHQAHTLLRAAKEQIKAKLDCQAQALVGTKVWFIETTHEEHPLPLEHEIGGLGHFTITFDYNIRESTITKVTVGDGYEGEIDLHFEVENDYDIGRIYTHDLYFTREEAEVRVKEEKAYDARRQTPNKIGNPCISSPNGVQ